MEGDEPYSLFVMGRKPICHITEFDRCVLWSEDHRQEVLKSCSEGEVEWMGAGDAIHNQRVIRQFQNFLTFLQPLEQIQKLLSHALVPQLSMQPSTQQDLIR